MIACPQYTTDSKPPQEPTTLRWVPVLMYHRVVDRVDGSDPYHLCISTADFGAQMAYLSRRGYQAIRLEDMPLAASGQSPWKRPVAITFDDGYRDTYTRAFPLLMRHGLVATIMLVSERIGGQSDWDPETVAAPLLSLEEIREMQRHGMWFGAHTATHASLPDISPEEVYGELAGCKTKLEQILDREILTLAFPYGRSTPEIRETAGDVGYHAAFGVDHGSMTWLNYSRIDAARCRGDTRLWRLKVAGVYQTFKQSPALRKLNDFCKRMLR